MAHGGAFSPCRGCGERAHPFVGAARSGCAVGRGRPRCDPSGRARDRPELLTRWGAERNWAGTDFRDPDRTVLCLRYAGEDGSPAYSMGGMSEAGTPPEDRAAAAVHRLATEDPRAYGA